MRITVTTGSAAVVRLEQPGDFRAFSVALSGGSDGLRSALQAAGAGDFDGSHAWIDPAWLRAEAASGPEWEQGFSSMLAYAAQKGWTDARGYVRAHVEEAGE